MLISNLTVRDSVNVQSSQRVRKLDTRFGASLVSLVLGWIQLAISVNRERRVLARLSPEERKDIGYASDAVSMEARRGVFDLPAQRVEALRRSVRHARSVCH